MLSCYWRRRKTKSQKEKQAKNRIKSDQFPEEMVEVLFNL